MQFRPEIRQHAQRRKHCMRISSYTMVFLPSFIVIKPKNFESKVIRCLCKLAGICKTRTTPYHPMGNGQVERFNQTLLQMLGCLDPCKKHDWKTYVSPLVHAYNATRHKSTGFCPFYLMFRHHPRLAIDAFLGLETNCD